MSGLELFMDGGATLAGAVSAGSMPSWATSSKRRTTASLWRIRRSWNTSRQNLGEAITSTCAAHAAITAAWGQPLSLFMAHGAQGVAVEALERAKQLVEEAAELEDLADVYDAQLQLAITQQRSLQRTPVRLLESRLDTLSLALTSHVPAVVLAKEAFKQLELEGDTVALQAALQNAKSYSEARESRLFRMVSQCFTCFSPPIRCISGPFPLQGEGIFVALSFPLVRAARAVMSC